MTKPSFWDEATLALARKDRVMKRLIDEYPDMHLQRRSDPFTALARAITGQQISVKAANSIWNRVVEAVGNTSRRGGLPRLDPAVVATTPADTLRACGLSASKAAYVRDLASHFASSHLEPRTWKRLSDEELILLLCEVKGIGRWTAEMFLIFHELRPDVLPVDDLGLRRAVERQYNRSEPMSTAAIRELGTKWQPYRSVATWYLWRSLEPVVVQGKDV